jgi:hypothetical protein
MYLILGGKMNTYKIADLIVKMNCNGRTLKQSAPYAMGNGNEEDIIVNIDKEKILMAMDKHPELSEDEWQYLISAGDFYNQLLDFFGMMLHASAIVYEDKAYLFSAPCGTGKSTHTALWLKYFGDKAYILNDDKPAIRFIDEGFYVYGTPWSGKYDISVNKKVTLQGICFLEQSKDNWIEPIKNREAITMLMHQTIRKLNMERMTKLLELLDRLVDKVPIFKMGCNIGEDAVKLSYNTMNGGEINEN